MAKLQDFIAKVKTTGYMIPSRYSVIFPNAAHGELLAMYCDQFQLPGLNINTSPSLTYGETREMPYTRLYDNINMSFYVDHDMKVKKYFDEWMASIQNPMDRTFSYYNSYIHDVQIDVEDLENNVKYSMILHECYPKTIGAIQLDYAAKDLMKISVTFAYKYWEPKFISSTNDNVTFLNRDAAGITTENQGVASGITKPLTIQYNALEIANREIAANAHPNVRINPTGW